MAMTRNGIFYNLDESFYKVEMEDTGLTFVFSSLLHKDKFLEEYEDFRKKINKSLSQRFNLPIEQKLIADLTLYKKIENRGFKVTAKGVSFEWQKGIILNGDCRTEKPLQER